MDDIPSYKKKNRCSRSYSNEKKDRNGKIVVGMRWGHTK